MAKQALPSLHHCVYSLNCHLVLATQYRREVITPQMMSRLRDIFSETLTKWQCKLIEFNGAEDQLHLLFESTPFESTPVVQLSKLVNNLKTVSSRLIRRDFPVEIRRVYWKLVFWRRSYWVLSAGGAPISVIRRDIEHQGSDDS